MLIGELIKYQTGTNENHDQAPPTSNSNWLIEHTTIRLFPRIKLFAVDLKTSNTADHTINISVFTMMDFAIFRRTNTTGSFAAITCTYIARKKRKSMTNNSQKRTILIVYIYYD